MNVLNKNTNIKPPDKKKAKIKKQKVDKITKEEWIAMSNERLAEFQKLIVKHRNTFKIPQKCSNNHFTDVDIHSVIDVREAINNNNFKEIPKNITFDTIVHDGFSTAPFLKLYLTKHQKIIIDKWIDCYTEMYNATIRYFNYKKFNNLSYETVNTLKLSMKNAKNKIHQSSKIIVKVNNKWTDVYVNKSILDYAINDAKNRLDACLTKMKKGIIRHFRLRYIKLTKKDRIMKLEKKCFSENTFCASVMGPRVKCSLDNYGDICSLKSLNKMYGSLCSSKNNTFNYVDNIDTVSILKKIGNEYFLLLKHSATKCTSSKTDTIAIDLGVRTIGTGYSEKKVIEMGTDMYDKMNKRLLDIDHIETLNKTKEKKAKMIHKRYEKIKNIVKDIHWKMSNYVTDNYKNIIIGNFSTKEMGENDNVRKMVKRVGQMMSMYKLRERIKSKCVEKGVRYKMINEEFTTQCCGRCGNQKKDVGAEKIYRCDKCDYEVPRDIHSSRLHIIKAMTKITKRQQIEWRKLDKERYK